MSKNIEYGSFILGIVFSLAFFVPAVSALPDLTINTIVPQVTTNATACTVVVVATVKNIGDSVAGNSTTRLSLNSGFTTLRATPGLNPSELVAVSSSPNVWIVGAGTYIGSARADAATVITESNETNNQKDVSFFCDVAVNQTHLACVGLACQTVAGGGSNTCASNVDCFHLKCDSVNRTCVKALGSGVNECATVGRACKPSPIKLSPSATNVPRGKAWGWWCGRMGLFCSKEARVTAKAQLAQAKAQRIEVAQQG